MGAFIAMLDQSDEGRDMLDAMSRSSLDIIDALDQLSRDAGTRAVIFAAAGKVSCSGHDLSEMTGVESVCRRMLYTNPELTMDSYGEITQVLRRLGAGEKAAESELIQLVYSELHRIAVGKLRRERPGHTLQPTALVNERYLTMMGKGAVNWENRAHFFAQACAMRRILAIMLQEQTPHFTLN